MSVSTSEIVISYNCHCWVTHHRVSPVCWRLGCGASVSPNLSLSPCRWPTVSQRWSWLSPVLTCWIKMLGPSLTRCVCCCRAQGETSGRRCGGVTPSLSVSVKCSWWNWLLSVCQLGRTERLNNTSDPSFSQRLRLDYHFETVQNLKLAIYDIDNSTSDLGDDDYLGGVEVTLGQVREPHHSFF